ncbi:MAG: hypothetical protein JNJ94_09595 [Chlorobi bacterium]|nr:hypothetical protein [Chlorobiota bacterium]
MATPASPIKTRKQNHWTTPLKGIACEDGIKQGRRFATFADWWRGTRHSDDMFWLLATVKFPAGQIWRLLACQFIRKTKIDRKGRTTWDLLSDKSRYHVTVAERYAHGLASDATLRKARKGAREEEELIRKLIPGGSGFPKSPTRVMPQAVSAAVDRSKNGWSAVNNAAAWTTIAAVWQARSDSQPIAERGAQVRVRRQHADIIREMFPAEEVEVLFNQYIAALTKQ